ncbi:uncharacterized protein LOC135113372 [Scylla paramamosain]|uniref:uncharacterized protein LOC135113372 n=1 Tax=Scylla paramamosain TaxID=85552 RepID=UPI003082DBE3
MGSPLGVLFANLFMGTIGTNTLQGNRPLIYCRYIDDIFVRIKNTEELQNLKERLTGASSLQFTYEESKGTRLPFLDVLVGVQLRREDNASTETANAHNATYSLLSSHMSNVPSPTAPPGTQHTGNCNASHKSSLTTVKRSGRSHQEFHQQMALQRRISTQRR